MQRNGVDVCSGSRLAGRMFGGTEGVKSLLTGVVDEGVRAGVGLLAQEPVPIQQCQHLFYTATSKSNIKFRMKKWLYHTIKKYLQEISSKNLFDEKERKIDRQEMDCS